MISTLTGEVLPTARATSSFAWQEIACKCGCNAAYVQQDALNKLQSLRDLLGKPIILNSACRCPIHNARVGGAPQSQHRATENNPSTAFDISVHDQDKDAIIYSAKAVGFKGLGINYNSFVHVDNRPIVATW
jgi:zinc D-Ala-D-Ala carboxypeptidase